MPLFPRTCPTPHATEGSPQRPRTTSTYRVEARQRETTARGRALGSSLVSAAEPARCSYQQLYVPVDRLAEFRQVLLRVVEEDLLPVGRQPVFVDVAVRAC